ncbi:MAG: PIN/TRAM domain-containing protein [Planctomycetota bacterium]
MKIALMILRAVFIVLSVAAAIFVSGLTEIGSGQPHALRNAVIWCAVIICAATGFSFLDRLFSKRALPMIAAVITGLLVGALISYMVGIAMELVLNNADGESINAIKIVLTLVICYLVISFVIRTRDNFRFIIPYVEFAKEVKGQRPMILDTSVIIDGRIADVVETKIITAPLVIPRFVLQEIHNVSDSADKLKRNRGRRGLDMLNRLQTSADADVRINETVLERGEAVDEKLVELSTNVGGVLVTNDFNLNKLATLQGVDVININDLAQALRPVILPGENMNVKVVKPGEGYDQGVGYLDDGTMVVVEHGRSSIGSSVNLVVTSLIQTSAGRMIFGRIDSDGDDSKKNNNNRGGGSSKKS